MSRGVEARGSIRALASRAPSVFFEGRAANKTAGGPGACSKIRAAERWLIRRGEDGAV